MSYKGAIAAGSNVRVTLALDASASGPASLLAGFARSGNGGSHTRGTVIVPGSNDTLGLMPDAKGMLQIFVDMAIQPDSGTLQVTSNEGRADEERIAGDTVWTYAVVPDGS